MKKFSLTMRGRHIFEAYVFMSPFIVGLLCFYIFPLIVSVRLSFSKVIRMVGFQMSSVGWTNYQRAFVFDTTFVPTFIQVIQKTFTETPLIIISSLILAILINKNFKFRGFFRIVFFIPFLLGTGDVMSQLLGLGVDKSIISFTESGLIPWEIVGYLGSSVSGLIDSFFGIIVFVLWSSGVQILLFLSGLQGISVSLYESAKVDGATEWEMFWKITLPMISPVILLNIIYTLIESFTNITNPLLSYIQTTAFGTSGEFGYAAALGWIYFIFIIVVILIVMGVLRGYISSSTATVVKGVKKHA